MYFCPSLRHGETRASSRIYEFLFCHDCILYEEIINEYSEWIVACTGGHTEVLLFNTTLIIAELAHYELCRAKFWKRWNKVE